MSRKITQQAIAAFMSAAKFNSGNTSVELLPNATYLKLHGNIIAIKYSDGSIHVSNAGWKSNTTKERLNGIPGVNVYQKKGDWFLNGKYWDGTDTKIN